MDENLIIEKSAIISSKISTKLLELTSHSNETLTVGVFSPIPGEVRWFEKLHEVPNVEFAVAHIISQTDMEFHPMDIELIRSGKIGFKIAQEHLNISVIPQVMLVPGLAFSPNCERLGRGKGYYDRFLAAYQGLKIGVCFEEQIFEKLVVDMYDVEMNLVITDENIYEKDQ